MPDVPLISVIVPVYKVEPYLDRCVQSIVDQTYRNLEIILVDDGSPDHCPQMCDAWAQKDSRIKVIHQENGGLSAARNRGIDAATGELIGFVDSDDYISPNMYALLYDILRRDGSDISACGVEMVFEDGRPSRLLTLPEQCTLSNKEAMEAIVLENFLKQPVWYKLYKSALVRNIPFPVGKYHEDVFWSWQAILAAQKVSITDEPCYFYVQRENSIMGETYSPKRLDALDAKQQRLSALTPLYPSLAQTLAKDLAFSCIYHGQLVLKHLHTPEQKKVLQHVASIFQSVQLNPKFLPFTHRCWVLLARLHFPLCCFIRNTLKIGD